MKVDLRSVTLFSLFFSATAHASFDPHRYPKHVASCATTTRDGVNAELSLSYVDINPKAKKTILMVHGWPGIWSTWSNQINEFKYEYHLVVPDLRGFGKSTHPGNPRTSGAMADFVADLVCVLNKAKVDSAICMGHDWGSQVCYEAARMRPDIFTAVVGIVVPYVSSAGPFIPAAQLAAVFPKLGYQEYFDNRTTDAIAELGQDIQRTLRATYRTVASPPPDAWLKSTTDFLGAYNGVEVPPIQFLSRKEEDYLVEQYGIQKFNFNLELYTHENRFATWEFANEQGNFTLPQPILAVYPTQDPVANWTYLADLLHSHFFLPNIHFQTMPGAHWAHMEFPETFNKIAWDWLKSLQD